MARIAAGLGRLALVVAGSAVAGAAGGAAITQAGVLNGAIVAGPVGGPMAVLARGQGWRDMPVISPDGTRVAFVQQVATRVALADVVVVGMDGREMSRTHIEPVEDNVAYTGMQYVETLQWISAARLVAGGSINPSTSQYYTIDAAAGKIVGDFTDDASQPAFSRDGQHMAVLADDPHFAPKAEAAPSLMLDGKPIWRPAQGTALVGAPRFSADGAQLAWAGRAPSGAIELDIWSGSQVHRVTLPARGDSDVHVFWSGSRAVASVASMGVAGKVLAWSADANGANFASQLPGDPAAGAVALRATLVAQAAQAGVKEADFWCASCALSLLPRRVQ